RATDVGSNVSPAALTATAAKTIAVSSGNNQTGVAGSALASSLAVLVTDGSSNPVSGITVNWSSITGGGSAGSPTSVTNVSGLASSEARRVGTGGSRR